MTGPFQAARVTDRVYWVGAIDWAIREFHGYSTRRGTSYNAFLVLADQPVLIDTVKAEFAPEMLSRIASVIEPSKIGLIISNHSEMDHSGAINEAIRACRPKQVVASANGVKALKAHFGLDGLLRAVKDGERIDLGNDALTFVETKMLHWPDSMFTYLAGDRVLFTQDAFGMHLATAEIFSHLVPEPVMAEESTKYFANILLPYAPLVAKLLKRFDDLALQIRVIAPDHGPIFRENPGWIVERYRGLATQQPTDKAVVVFDTMWHSTERMALAIAEGLRSAGASPVKVLPLSSTHRSDVATEVFGAGALLVGSPTINNSLFPSVAGLLTYLSGLKPRGLIGAAFGSYGWSGEATARIEEQLESMQVRRVAEALKTQYVPDGQALARCRALGARVAEARRERAAGTDREPTIEVKDAAAAGRGTGGDR